MLRLKKEGDMFSNVFEKWLHFEISKRVRYLSINLPFSSNSNSLLQSNPNTQIFAVYFQKTAASDWPFV